MKDFSAHFRALVERELPQDARVFSPGREGEIIVLATWRLGTDPARPNKRSRMVRVVISEEAIADYARGSDGMRLAGDQRLVVWFRKQLAGFDPDHDTPLGVEPPSVTWSVDTLLLNG